MAIRTPSCATEGMMGRMIRLSVNGGEMEGETGGYMGGRRSYYYHGSIIGRSPSLPLIA